MKHNYSESYELISDKIKAKEYVREMIGIIKRLAFLLGRLCSLSKAYGDEIEWEKEKEIRELKGGDLTIR